jgi:hypothetical protein
MEGQVFKEHQIAVARAENFFKLLNPQQRIFIRLLN